MTIDKKSLMERVSLVNESIRNQTSIAIDESLRELLEDLKIVPRESYNSLIVRILKENADCVEKELVKI